MFDGGNIADLPDDGPVLLFPLACTVKTWPGFQDFTKDADSWAWTVLPGWTLRNGTPESTVERWPLPISHISSLQQSAFWEVQVARYGALALSNFPKVEGQLYMPVNGNYKRTSQRNLDGAEWREGIAGRVPAKSEPGVWDERSAAEERARVAKAIVARCMNRLLQEQSLFDQDDEIEMFDDDDYDEAYEDDDDPYEETMKEAVKEAAEEVSRESKGPPTPYNPKDLF